jgi:hypothetical protein
MSRNTAYTSEAEVPQAIKNKLASLYTDLNKVKWHRENENYEASFINGKAAGSLLFDAEGNVREIEIAIPVSLLPVGIRDYIYGNFNSREIKEAVKIVNDKGMIMYEARLENAGYTFSSSGRFLAVKEKRNA